MRLVVGGSGKVRLIRRDQRDAVLVGEIDQRRLDAALGGHAVALQLHVKAVAEQRAQRLKPRAGEMALAGGNGEVERAARAAGERDHALGFAGEPVELEPRRLVRRGFEEGARVEPHQTAVAFGARGEEDDARALLGDGRAAAGAMVGVAEVDGERATDDGLDAVAGELLGEFQAAEHVVGVGERQCRLLVGLRQLGEARNGKRAFEQRIGRVHVQVHEVQAGHG
jgi:hypothetical protein